MTAVRIRYGAMNRRVELESETSKERLSTMAEHVRNLETSAGGAFSLSSGTEKVTEITFDAVCWLLVNGYGTGPPLRGYSIQHQRLLPLDSYVAGWLAGWLACTLLYESHWRCTSVSDCPKNKGKPQHSARDLLVQDTRGGGWAGGFEKTSARFPSLPSWLSLWVREPGRGTGGSGTANQSSLRVWGRL
jgi:hypothetical protein